MTRIGSLCTGAGLLDLAAEALFPNPTHAWVAEIDNDANTVLAARYGAPNLGDVTRVDWTRVEPVDVLVAGYPCTDLSNAGKRAGIEGAHSGIWRDVAAAIRDLRPRLVLLENVAAHLARGFGRVHGDLAAVRYDTQWLCLRASDVGAPHQRDRVFIAAAPADADGSRVWLEPVAVRARHGEAVAGGDRQGALMPTLMPTPRASEGAKGGPRGSSGDLTLTSSVMLLPTPGAALGRGSGVPSRTLAESRRESGRRFLDDAVVLLPTPTATNSHGNQVNNRGEMLLPGAVADRGRWAQYGPAIARWEAETGRLAPDATTIGQRGGKRLSARFVEWMMGAPAGWVTDLVDNTAALRLLGNGVVRQQAIAAYLPLIREAA